MISSNVLSLWFTFIIFHVQRKTNVFYCHMKALLQIQDVKDDYTMSRFTNVEKTIIQLFLSKNATKSFQPLNFIGLYTTQVRLKGNIYFYLSFVKNSCVFFSFFSIFLLHTNKCNMKKLIKNYNLKKKMKYKRDRDKLVKRELVIKPHIFYFNFICTIWTNFFVYL